MSTDSAAPDADRPGLIARVSAAAIRWALTRRPVRAFLLYSERRGPMLADSVTYRALFSVFAGVLLGFSIAALWLAGNPDAWKAIIAAVQSVVPGLIGDGGIIDPSDLEAPVSLSIAGAISVIALTGSALAAVGSLRTAVRLLAGTAQADILFIWVMLRNLLLAIGIGLAFVAAAAVTFIGRIGITWIAGLLGIADDSAPATWSIRIVSLVVVLALDTALIAGVFRLLSGTRPSARSLWTGALLGGIGLLVLQELSGLFIGGATSNPLLASFASLLALLIWLNLSTQVILISCAYIVTSEEERHDRVHARFGATTFPQRRVQRAEAEVALATDELRAAQKAEKEFRTGSTAD
ncbi:YhjD/YihY/BrkB family envelope integrity protein [Microbacterium sp. Leaf320]|uniref:YhjD/YihY/BrkB family envelope integrity protein n=1 Tax=Microbacterium sp. Leaf320 TaxID=1736334 RepID=UPI0006FF66ED|nr:YhjD/YihY/BrkB family envelope integrity protein [Microbacterium sp. Leaf320]KQQ68901.1 ribonuclease BN [Microbacterium sp. Leaf320]